MRHSRRCASRSGSECSCTPTYQAQVWSARDRKPIRKTFPTVAGALAWRQETQVALRRGTLRAPTATTLAEAAEAWLARRRGGHHPHPFRRPLQTLCASQLPPRATEQALARARPPSPLSDQAQRPPRPRRPDGRRRPFTEHRPKHDPALARDLPPRDRPRRARRQPDPETAAPRRARQTRPSRASRRSRGPPRRPTARRPRALGNRPLRRPPPRRTPSTRMDRHQPRRQPHPRQPLLGPQSRLSSHRKAAPASRRVPITNALRQHLLTHRLRQGRGQTRLRLRQQQRPPLRPRSHPRPSRKSLATAETCNQSPCTSAATPTPPS